MPLNQAKPNPIYLIYMFKEDLALNNLQKLNAIKLNQTKIVMNIENIIM